MNAQVLQSDTVRLEALMLACQRVYNLTLVHKALLSHMRHPNCATWRYIIDDEMRHAMRERDDLMSAVLGGKLGPNDALDFIMKWTVQL